MLIVPGWSKMTLTALSLPGTDKAATRLLPNLPAAPRGACPVPLHPSGVCVAVGSTVTLLLPLLALTRLGKR